MPRPKKSLLSKEAKAAIKEANRQKKLALKIYKEKIKEMRPYLKSLRKIDLRKPISSGQKSFVSKAWEEYTALTIRPTKIFRTKNKKKLRIAQTASQHTGKIRFDVAFVPTVDNQASIKIKGDKLIVSSKYVEEAKIMFDMRAMAIDPEGELNRVLKENPEFSQFVLMAGEYIWNGGISRSRVVARIMPQLMRYMPGGEGYEKRGPNSHYMNWALGLRGYKAKNQLAIEDYLAKYNKAVRAKKEEAKSKRRRRGQKYGTKF